MKLFTVFVVLMGMFIYKGHCDTTKYLNPEENVFFIPEICHDLIPDKHQFTMFINTVGKGLVEKEPTVALKIFELIEIKKAFNTEFPNYTSNPVDDIITGNLCKFKGSRSDVSFRSANLISYLRKNVDIFINQSITAIRKFRRQEAENRKLRKELSRFQKDIEQLKTRARKNAKDKVSIH